VQEELDEILEVADVCPEDWAEMIQDLANAGDFQDEDFNSHRGNPQRLVEPNPEQLGQNCISFLNWFNSFSLIKYLFLLFWV
jgi:hypothetical protein